MTYQPSKPLLLIEHDSRGYASSLEMLNWNGRIVRSHAGERLGWVGKYKSGLEFLFMRSEQAFHGVISDRILSARVLEYIQQFYDSHLTNCSSFAHYLTTGEFVACKKEDRFVVNSQGMRPISQTSRIDVGDMVWIAYTTPSLFRSRISPHRKNFLRAQKVFHTDNQFTSVMSMSPKSRGPEVIKGICQDPSIEDYHFMVCVGKYQGGSIWLFQNGYHVPGEEQIGFGMTIGFENPYPSHPLLAYIKKRR